MSNKCGAKFCLGIKSPMSETPELIMLLAEEFLRAGQLTRSGADKMTITAEEAVESMRLHADVRGISLDVVARGHDPEGELTVANYTLYIASFIETAMRDFLDIIEAAATSGGGA